MKKIIVSSVFICALLYFTAADVSSSNSRHVNGTLLLAPCGPTGPVGSPGAPGPTSIPAGSPGGLSREDADSVQIQYKADALTRQMENQFNLTSDQTPKVLRINFIYMNQLGKMQSSSSTTMPNDKIKEINNTWIKALNGVLTATQQEQFNKIHSTN